MKSCESVGEKSMLRPLGLNHRDSSLVDGRRGGVFGLFTSVPRATHN